MSETVRADEVTRLKDEVAQLHAKLDRRARWQTRALQTWVAGRRVGEYGDL